MTFGCIILLCHLKKISDTWIVIYKCNFTFQIQSGINLTNTNFHKHIDINLISRLKEIITAALRVSSYFRTVQSLDFFQKE